VQHHGGIRAGRSPVGPQHDVGVEDRDERVEVAVVRRAKNSSGGLRGSSPRA